MNKEISVLFYKIRSPDALSEKKQNKLVPARDFFGPSCQGPAQYELIVSTLIMSKFVF